MRTQVRYPTRAASKNWGFHSFTPHCLSSLSCKNEYLAIDSGVLCVRIVYRAVIAPRPNASQRSLTCVCTNRSARGVIVSAWNGQVDWILHVKHLTLLKYGGEIAYYQSFLQLSKLLNWPLFFTENDSFYFRILFAKLCTIVSQYIYLLHFGTKIIRLYRFCALIMS